MKTIAKICSDYDISVGKTIKVHVAHSWNVGYGYSDYMMITYIVEKITRSTVIGRRVDWEHEIISITAEDIDSGMFIISCI